MTPAAAVGRDTVIRAGALKMVTVADKHKSWSNWQNYKRSDPSRRPNKMATVYIFYDPRYNIADSVNIVVIMNGLVIR